MKKSDSVDQIHASYTLDPLLTSEIRFFIMSLLAMYDEVDFGFLKKELGATDGNLSSNLSRLEEAGYLAAKKQFVGKRPKTTYRISDLGLSQLQDYIESIHSVREKFVKRG
jgi:DNA-binding HxlR family transcriptional regulator